MALRRLWSDSDKLSLFRFQSYKILSRPRSIRSKTSFTWSCVITSGGHKASVSPMLRTIRPSLRHASKHFSPIAPGFRNAFLFLCWRQVQWRQSVLCRAHHQQVGDRPASSGGSEKLCNSSDMLFNAPFFHQLKIFKSNSCRNGVARICITMTERAVFLTS